MSAENLIQFPRGLAPPLEGNRSALNSKRIEIASAGIDEFKQLLAGDPYGDPTSVGLRVPTLATPDFRHRYLFNACSFSIGEGARARIVGWRQLVTLGFVQSGDPPRLVEQVVTSPVFCFADGNVSWHLRQLGGPNGQGLPPRTPAPNDLRNFNFRFIETPALLYENATLPAGNPFYVHLTDYTPPNSGQPWGYPLSAGHQGTFYDLRTPWETHGAWNSLDVELDGPATVALFISVGQTNPGREGRVALTPPSPLFPNGLSDEEQFLLNFPSAIYWRVGGSLIVEVD
jgi:hypothetical protein